MVLPKEGCSQTSRRGNRYVAWPSPARTTAARGRKVPRAGALLVLQPPAWAAGGCCTPGHLQQELRTLMWWQKPVSGSHSPQWIGWPRKKTWFGFSLGFGFFRKRLQRSFNHFFFSFAPVLYNFTLLLRMFHWFLSCSFSSACSLCRTQQMRQKWL